jgi:hypothetical protein
VRDEEFKREKQERERPQFFQKTVFSPKRLYFQKKAKKKGRTHSRKLYLQTFF